MSAELAVVADPEDASLAGLAAPDGSAGAPASPAPVVALGSAEVAGSGVAVRWLDGVPEGGRPDGERLIAPAGEGLWRTAPWPAADALFELEPAAEGDAIVVGADPAARDAVAERAAARGVAVEPVERLDAGRLAGAACVVFADAPGHALTASTRLATAPPTGALPARAFAVLAARRFLIVPGASRSPSGWRTASTT